MEYPRPEYWSGLPFPSPGDLPNPSTKPTSWQAILYHWALFKLTQCYMSTACMCAKSLQSRLTVTVWTTACQAPLSTGFSRQEYWSELPCPSPGDPPSPGIEPVSLMSPVLAGSFFTTCAMLYLNKAGGSETYLKKITHREGRNIC